MVDLAESTGFYLHTWQLAWSISHFLDKQLHWHEWVASQHAALRAAEHLEDRAGQAHAHRYLGDAAVQVGHCDGGREHLTTALDLYRGLNHDSGQALTYHSLSLLAARQGDHHQAVADKRHALSLFGRIGNRPGEAGVLNGIGWELVQLDQFNEALTYCEQGLAISQESGDYHLVADTWDSVGNINYRLGHAQQALICYREALDRFRALGDCGGEVETLEHIGDIHHKESDTAAAADS